MNYSSIQEISEEAKYLDFVKTAFSKAKRPHVCFYCGKKLTEETMTRDHLIPKSRSLSQKDFQFNRRFSTINIVSSCRPCNQLKRSLSVYDFRELVLRKKPERYKAIVRNIDEVLNIPIHIKLILAGKRNINNIKSFFI